MCLACMGEAITDVAGAQIGTVIELQRLSGAIESRWGILSGAVLTIKLVLHSRGNVCSRELVRLQQVSWTVNGPCRGYLS